MPRPLLAALVAACWLAAATLAFAAPAPHSLRVAWLDGRSIADAAATGAVLRDRFPDAVLVGDDASAEALRADGFRVDAPFTVPDGLTVTLVRDRVVHPDERWSREAFAQAGAILLWSGGRNAIAASPGPLPEEAPGGHHARKVLSREPLVVRAGGRVPSIAEQVQVTDFAPAIQALVNQVDGTRFMDWIRDMANGRSTLVGGVPVTFTTRSTPTTLCDQAEQWAFERLQALGYTDVQYDPYTFSSTSARNVVATLPGVTAPNKIVVLGAHLDSTSPNSTTLAPGANDNASGVAGLLEIARILRTQSFDYTIKFVVFTGEEQGLYGSEHYAAAAAARGDSIVGAVIFDMIGWHNVQNKIDVEGETAYLPLMNVMIDACARYTSITTNTVIGSWGSDHVPFQNHGYSAFLAIENEYPSYPCYHKTCDSVAWNQPVFGSEVIKAGLATVAQVARIRDFYIVHTPLANTENTLTPYEVIADIGQLSPLVADSTRLWWNTGGPWSSVPLAATGTPGRWHAYIPAQPRATVQYWIGAKDDAGRHAFHPAAAPAAVNTFVVAPRETLLAEGFESGAPGWAHGGTNDDWQVSTPYGLTEDPAAAYEGTKFAGTDISGLGSVLGRYENSSDTWFESPAVDCSLATGTRLLFARKLAVERSNSLAWDYARVWVNNTKIWESASGTNTLDAAWTPQEFDISAIADGQKSVKIRWTLHSDGSVNYGGWNLDAVRITALKPAPAATGVDDAPGAAAFALHAAVPNPMFASATLRFDLARESRAELALYDLGGRRVRTLASGMLAAGRHAFTWDGRDDEGRALAAGVYFVRLGVGAQHATRRLTLLR
ncbi:MAG: M20/M25/M40 family metallo-hydrolase [Candidatus Eisenbacteria bacterium]